MVAPPILGILTTGGFGCRAEGDRLIVHPADGLTDPLRAMIRSAKPDLLAYLHSLPTPANDPQPDLLAAVFGYAVPQDDRIQCQACRNLATSGRCLAARRLPGMASWHEPDPSRHHACYAFLPLASDPDPRPGKVRWPSLAWMARS
ncbi:MAG: hypothetical protein KAX51_07215 [Chromatiaceae bacterium]|nr:hypothetical protein [Chromatiaceae bacterium]MBP8289576.1 hypothetical protein [Chromatiaceae bacterium]